MLTHRQLFLNHVAQTSDAPMMLEIVKAEGVTLTDVNGKKYIDLISGISVSNVGHCHPDVVKAVKEQSEKYMHRLHGSPPHACLPSIGNPSDDRP